MLFAKIVRTFVSLIKLVYEQHIQWESVIRNKTSVRKRQIVLNHFRASKVWRVTLGLAAGMSKKLMSLVCSDSIVITTGVCRYEVALVG